MQYIQTNNSICIHDSHACSGHYISLSLWMVATFHDNESSHTVVANFVLHTFDFLIGQGDDGTRAAGEAGAAV